MFAELMTQRDKIRRDVYDVNLQEVIKGSRR